MAAGRYIVMLTGPSWNGAAPFASVSRMMLAQLGSLGCCLLASLPALDSRFPLSAPFFSFISLHYAARLSHEPPKLESYPTMLECDEVGGGHWPAPSGVASDQMPFSSLTTVTENALSARGYAVGPQRRVPCAL